MIKIVTACMIASILSGETGMTFAQTKDQVQSNQLKIQTKIDPPKISEKNTEHKLPVKEVNVKKPKTTSVKPVEKKTLAPAETPKKK